MTMYTRKVANQGEGFSFSVEEGTFTRSETLLTDSGIMGGGSFGGQVSDGQFVEIYTGADRAVTAASTGMIIGVIDGDPVGMLPSATTTSGGYTRRKVNVLVTGGDIYKVRLDAANAAITPGYQLAMDGTNIDRVDYEDGVASGTLTSTSVIPGIGMIALESAAASSGDSILALVTSSPRKEV